MWLLDQEKSQTACMPGDQGPLKFSRRQIPGLSEPPCIEVDVWALPAREEQDGVDQREAAMREVFCERNR